MKIYKKILVMMCVLMILGGSVKSKAEATPRLMVIGYEITEGNTDAGKEFTIVFHLKNESKKTALSNIKFTISSSGNEFIALDSASLYEEKIAIGEEKDISFKVKSRADLEQKPYALTLKAEYEDRYNQTYETSDEVLLYINQPISLLINETEISPGTINVGSRANIMFNINNTGKGTAYKTTVEVTGDGIEPTLSYVGDVLPGTISYFDTMILGKTETSKDGLITATVTYEDLDGNKFTDKKEFYLEIKKYEDVTKDVAALVPENIEKPFPVGMIVGAIVIILIIVLIIRKKKNEDD